ncbi:msx2-interacting protein isoform X3 [Lissotriton helveticus]
MVRETRHLWVGNLPESVREEKIIEHFKRYGRVESVKILPKRGSDGGVAAFVDFVDIKSAQKAHNAVNKMGDRDLRTDYNEPGTIPSAARGLDDTVSITSRTREVSGFRGGAGGPTYGTPTSLHAREGRYERRLDGASDNRERAYEHSAYGHHERGTGGFDRTRHYDQDYYSRDPRERTLQHGIYYTSRSRSPTRFDAHDARYEPRTREQFTLPSVVHRDIYRDDLTREVRGRRADRNYQQSRSRSPHSSQSRTQSPQRLPGQATRPARSPSGSGSRSRSSSSDSVSSSGSTSSDSSDSSSSSSDESPARSVQSTAVPAPPSQPLPPLDKDEPRKSFGVKVQNLPVRSTDTSLKDGLFHEFKKYGKVTSVQIHGVSEERYGLVFFRQQEDQEKALISSKGKLFFGMQIEVTAWVGPETESENEFRPLDERIDEFHPKATRTLFIGNLEKTTTYHDLRLLFQRFGEIVDIDIKKLNGVPNYAFLQYCDIASVCKAIKKMDGEFLGNNRLKVAYDRLKGMAMVLYNETEYAQAAVKETKGRKIGGKKNKVDFANRESQLAFYRSMDTSGQDIRDFYELLAERRGEEPRRGSYHEYTAAERTYFDSVRTPGTYPEEPRREFPARSRELYADWDPYQTEYFDSRYYDDLRELRDYRDPYEQDIREYSYRQRERERERERFESDRDHEKRPLERSQSPAHSRRPKSPVTSPSQSDTRLQSDPERRIYSRSSDRSESCSSLSPPRFDKPDKVRTERFVKNEKTEKEQRPFDLERTEKEKRAVKKEKPEKLEKDKSDKVKRKTKLNSPSSQSSGTDQENEQDSSPDKKSTGKQSVKEKVDKEGSSKNRLDLIPCVVLTRVKEKEGKVDSSGFEKMRGKLDRDSVKSPPLEQKIQLSRIEQPKSDPGKPEALRTKTSKEKILASHVEVVDKEGKVKAKKQQKTEQSIEVTNPVDLEKLEARKRRFADANMKQDRQKLELKKSIQEEEDARLILKKQFDGPGSSREVTMLRDVDLDRKISRKELPRRELKQIKSERLITVTSPKDGQESANISVGIALRPSSDLQARLGEPVEAPLEMQEILVKKISLSKPHQRHSQIVEDQGTERDLSKEDGRRNYCDLLEVMADHKIGYDKTHSSETEEKLSIDIDHTQSYRKQMELSRRLKQQMEIEMAKSERFGSATKEVDDFDKRSLVHEVGKPPQDVTDDSPPSKKRKTDHLEFENLTKRERNYRSSRQMNKDSERTVCSPGLKPILFQEEEDNLDCPRLMPIRDTKESPKIDDKSPLYSGGRENALKCNPNEFNRKEQLSDIAKVKLSVTCEDELNKWDCQVKQEPGRGDATFQSSAMKKERSRSLHDLEPGEVPTDSDEDSDHKTHSPKASSLLDSSRFSFLLRDGDEKLRDREDKLASSSERGKFYSFALDKTITPDTKALLERAKSLSSSREENWSFLDWDQRFANLRNNKDKEKVDSAPRRLPSWYTVKKKKIRTDSEGKLDDKKDDNKEDEHERTELFASRFLHSSIFEQDSKRLQHLEKKDDELDFQSSRLFSRQMSSDGANSISDFVQEPVVLFHSRFIELTRMQQKEKEKDQRPKELEKPYEIIQPKTPDPIPDTKEMEMKPRESFESVPCIRSPQEPALSVAEKTLNENMLDMASTKDKMPLIVIPAKDKLSEISTVMKDKLADRAAPTKDKLVELAPQIKDKLLDVFSATKDTLAELAPVPEIDSSKDKLPDHAPEETESAHSQLEIKPIPDLNIQSFTTHPEQVEIPLVMEENKESIPIPPLTEDSMVVEQRTYLDAKPLTPGSSFAEDICEEEEPESASCIMPTATPVAKTEEPNDLKEDIVVTCENINSNISPMIEVVTDIQPLSSDRELEVEPPTPVKDRKSYKNKRSKTPVQASVPAVSEKPATRKSERIDREKRNRSTSPRGETHKLMELKIEPEKVTRNASKSPCSVPEVDIVEPAGRSRRRKVKSVYATKVIDSPPLVKEPVETPRPTRKKIDKEHQETVAIIPTTPRRGRPRKSRCKIGEETSPLKVEPVKLEVEETITKETLDVPKPVEGWRSPRSQKIIHNQQGKKGRNEQKISPEVSLDSSANEPATPEPLAKECCMELKSENEALDGESKQCRKADDVDQAAAENHPLEIIEKKTSTEKFVRSKGGRSRNIKNAIDQANVRIRNVEIRLNVDEVKGALRTGEDESESMIVSPVKIKSPVKEDGVSPPFMKMELETPFPETSEKEVVPEPKPSPEAAQLAKQIELEQAVENIEKITENPSVAAYKAPGAEVSYKEPEPEVSEVRPEEEGDKPTHQASETELLTAIGSIICDVSAEAESFPAPPTYPPNAETDLRVEPVVVQLPQEVMEPETDHAVNNILNSETSVGADRIVCDPASTSKEAVERKETETNLIEPPINSKEADRLTGLTVPRKEKGRPKSSRQRRTRSTSKKAEAVDNVVELQIVKGRPIKKEVKIISETLLEDKKNSDNTLLEPVEQPPSKSDLVTGTEDISQDTPIESKTPAEPAAPGDLPHQPTPENEESMTILKQKTHFESSPITPPTISGVPSVPSTISSKLPTAVPVGLVHHSGPVMVTDWMSRHDDSRARSTPPPALPPDTKASDIDNNSSTLRKILLEYVSPTSNTTTVVTTSISEPVSTSRMEEKMPNLHCEVVKDVSEEKCTISQIPQSTAAQIPPEIDANVFTEKDKVTTIIAPKMTSVISRMPPSLDLDDTPRISLVKTPSQSQSSVPTMPSPKYKQRSTGNDRSCMKPAMSVIEDRSVEAGSSPGLRVSTSEGFVILSYSGQKTEGPQRISAKISQIPPASAVDIEFQQSVSKSQVKQESVSSSQLATKGPQTTTDYIPGHSSLMPGSQPYNSPPVISSVKQERCTLEKPDSLHLSGSNPSSQPGTLKLLSQTVNTAPVLMHNHMGHSQTIATSKKITEQSSLKVDTKVLQPTNLSPGLSPHHSSFPGKMHAESNHVNSGPSTPTDRALPHLGVVKQEPHSPRTTGHSPSPFNRSCHPNVTSSSALTSNPSVLLAQGIPVPQYISSMHPEQTVIMPPHSHLSQGDVRMSTPPLSGMPYSIRSDALHSPRASVQSQIDIRPQQSSTPQPAPIREILSSLSSQHPPDEDVHYRHSVCRGSASVQSEVLVMQPEYRIPTSGMRLDPYSVQRDVRLMMHSHMTAVGDHHTDVRQTRTPDGTVKTPPASKTPQPGKEIAKSSEGKMAHSTHSESRLLNVPPSNQLPGLPLPQTVVVPPGVPLIHPSASSFHDYLPVYSDIRSYHHSAAQLAHTQFPGSSPIGLAARSMTPSQGLSEGDHAHCTQPVRSKTPQISQDLKAAPSAIEQPHHQSVNRHIGQMETHIQHLQRTQVETVQTSYPSPGAIPIKQDLSSIHQTQAGPKQPLFVANPSLPSAPPGMCRSEHHSVLKQDPAVHAVSQKQVDMMELLAKYPIVWQGLLALKNDTAAVQLHFVSGNNVLAHRSLPAPEGGPPLRIAQRMRLEASQLEGVARRMTVESDYCLLLAMPCGLDQEDVVNQTESLKAAFISYLQAKQAAGIINVPNPGSNQPAYVLQIFPPCEFSESHLSRLAPDLLSSVSNISPHLMIVIASV